MMQKRLILLCYILVLVAMAAATVMEKSLGTDFVSAHVYGSWWFAGLWAVLAATGLVFYLRHRVRSLAVSTMHVAFVVILLGALLTHLLAQRGMMQLRVGQTTDAVLMADGESMTTERLPFSLRLNRFTVDYHDGTSAAQDYRSELTIIDNGEQRATVSMNRILSHRSYRFYQASYDDDLQGTVLSVYHDPWGIGVTYVGYALLFLSLVGMLIEPRGSFRRLLKSQTLRRGALMLVGLTGLSSMATATPSTLPRETADRLGRLCMLAGDRICPLQTYALDLTKKLHGARSYDGLTPEQVVAGFLFYGDEWAREPFIRVKSGPLKERLQLPDYCAVNAFFNPTMGGYILGPYVEQYYNGQTDKLHQQAADLDNRLRLLMELQHGSTLRVLPYTYDRTTRATPTEPAHRRGQTTWFAPADELPKAVEAEHAKYISNVFRLMTVDIRAGRFDRVNVFLDKMRRYQRLNAGTSLPSPTRLKAERLYNAVPFATILFMANLTLGFLALGYTVMCMSRGRRTPWIDAALTVLMILSWLALTTALALRWTISGNIPMSNGYETMIVVAWLVELVALIAVRRARIVLVFGFLLSGFFLLVSHISQMDPAIGQMMPVLNSPLLSVHVSIVMMAYALLSLTFLCALMGLTVRRMAEELQVLSQLFLLPAMTCLGLGIFIGAIWANMSWGAYWSWDPKETWALITMMVYAAPLHATSLPAFRRPRVFHAYLAAAFLTIVITYFGVNYFLGGMHSYA